MCHPELKRTIVAACAAVSFSLLATAGAVAQSTWTLLNPALKPAMRSSTPLASDLARKAVWLFSGGLGTTAYPNDTWSWNGVTWVQHNPAASPTGRYGHTMVYDESRARVVLFGGMTSGGIVGETWEWDGINWQQATPATSPVARYEHAAAYDRVRARTVVFGGSNGAGETWEWNGTNWTQMSPLTSPSARRGHSMAYHTRSNKVVLFGGSAGGDETWEWDGTNWTLRQPAVKPPTRIYFSMCEDLARGPIVMFSGRPNYTIDTWEWDGSEWTQRQPANTPPGRAATAMAFDPLNLRPVLFGGNVLTPVTARFDETWLFHAVSADFASYGAGCAGTLGVPSLDAQGKPWLGQSWTVSVSNIPSAAPVTFLIGASNTIWSSQPLPLSLTAFGMPGCSLRTSPDVNLGLTATSGVAALTIPIPNNAALTGVSAYFQSLVLNVGANAAGVIASNAAKAQLAGL